MVKCRVCTNEYSKPETVDETTYFVCPECGDVYEVKNYCPQTKEQLIIKIEAAFSDVTLGNGTGLFEAQAIDDYEPEKVQIKQRKKDEKNSWKSITHNVLQDCHSSLSFFDANGMRFHLSAYIIGSIREKVDDPLFHLTQLDDYAQSKLVALNKVQKNVVTEYLTWCLTENEYQFDCKDILKALNTYWNKTPNN